MYNCKIEALPVEPTFLGEGPHWDDKSGELYYVDIVDKSIHRFHLKTKKHHKIVLDEDMKGIPSASLIVPIEGKPNHFVIGHGSTLKQIHWDPESGINQISTIFETEQQFGEDIRFNDGKCDNAGRLWTGTMASYSKNPTAEDKIRGSIYKLETNGKTSREYPNVGVSNGLAWSKDNSTFYYIDSYTARVDAFDFDFEKGKLTSAPRTVYDFTKENEKGVPDGMTIDSDGNLWVACYNGSQVIHLDPKTGKLLGRILMPTQYITSVTFGGENLDELYVTSVKLYLTPEQEANQPLAGSVFKVTGLGIKGMTPGIPYKSIKN